MRVDVSAWGLARAGQCRPVRCDAGGASTMCPGGDGASTQRHQLASTIDILVEKEKKNCGRTPPPSPSLLLFLLSLSMLEGQVLNIFIKPERFNSVSLSERVVQWKKKTSDKTRRHHITLKAHLFLYQTINQLNLKPFLKKLGKNKTKMRARRFR